MRNRLIRIAGVGGFLLLLAQPGLAQTDVSKAITLNPPTTRWDYTPFTVTAAGNFNLFTLSSNLAFPSSNDPWIYLFFGSSSDGSGLGALIRNNDDGIGGCGSANNLDSCIFNWALGLGNYTLATGLFLSSESDARNNTYTGYYNNTGDHDITVRITSNNGTTDLVNAVPEPASMALLATGLIGLYGAARRRRSSMEA